MYQIEMAVSIHLERNDILRGEQSDVSLLRFLEAERCELGSIITHNDQERKGQLNSLSSTQKKGIHSHSLPEMELFRITIGKRGTCGPAAYAKA